MPAAYLQGPAAPWVVAAHPYGLPKAMPAALRALVFLPEPTDSKPGGNDPRDPGIALRAQERPAAAPVVHMPVASETARRSAARTDRFHNARSAENARSTGNRRARPGVRQPAAAADRNNRLGRPAGKQG